MEYEDWVKKNYRLGKYLAIIGFACCFVVVELIDQYEMTIIIPIVATLFIIYRIKYIKNQGFEEIRKRLIMVGSWWNNCNYKTKLEIYEKYK